MLRPAKDERGLTLVELILAMMVLGIISGVVANLLAYYNGLGRMTYLVLQKQNELQSVVNRILDGFGEKSGLITAKAYSLSGTLDPCGLGDTAYRSSIAFTITDNTVFTYRYESGQLFLKVDDAPEMLLMENLSCFAVKENGTNIVQLRIRSTVSGTGGERPVEIATQVKPRNAGKGGS
ncbi:MAG TPA: type II secretion system protein [Firmicutes bacterium]|nr:type II secretion system protein [Bacillota bacterium]